MQAAFHKSDDTLSDSERITLYDDLQKEAEEELEKIATQCGVDLKTLDALMDKVFVLNEDSSESEAAKEIA